MMDFLRAHADAGHAVIVVAALNRGDNSSSKPYNSGITSFRDSSAIEYGADNAIVLEVPDTAKTDTGDGNGNIAEAVNEHNASKPATVKIVKNRWGALGEYPGVFDGPTLTWSVKGGDVE